MRCVLWLNVLILLMAVPGWTQEQDSAEATVTLETQAKRFVMGEPVPVRVTLRVTGKTSVKFPADVRQYWGFKVTPPRGEAFYGRAWPIVCPVPGSVRPSGKAMLPGEVVIYDVNLLDEVTDLFGSVGVHDVELTVDSRFEVGKLTHPPLHSPPLRIRIDAPKGVNAKAYKEMLTAIQGDIRGSGELFYVKDKLSKRITEKYADSVYAPYAHFELGNKLFNHMEERSPRGEKPSLYDRERLREAQLHYSNVLTHFPKFACKPQLLLRSAKVSRYLGNYFAARRDLTLLLDGAPDTETAAEARWLYREIRKEEEALSKR